MYKSLLIACAFIAPVLAQDEPAPDKAPEGAPQRPMRGGDRGSFAQRGELMKKLVMEKYDVNKDGKLDDTEKAALKADAEKIREEREKARRERASNNENRREGGEARPEGRRRPGGQGEGRGEGRRPGGNLSREEMTVGQALLMEKYDKDKDGRLSREELEAIRKDAESLKKEEAPSDAAPASAE